MIRLLSIIALVCLTITGDVAAQTTTPKLLLSSEISKYDAGVVRNRPAVAQQSFNDAMSIINDEIALVTQLLQNATTQAQISALTARLAAEQQIKTDLQALQSNLMTNHAQVKTKLTDFVSYMD